MAATIRTIADNSEHYTKCFGIIKRQLSPIQEWTDKIFQNQIPEYLNIENRDLKALGVGSGSEDSVHYTKCFGIIKRQLSLMQEWADTIFQNKIPEYIENRDLKVLGVGSGSGELEFKNTLQLLRRFSTISHTVIEPAKDHVDEYKQLVTKEAEKLKSVKYHWRQQTLDQYRHEIGTSKKYDVIVSINSAYYFDNIEDSLMYLYDILEEGGILVIVTVSENGLSYLIWNRFPKFYQDFPFHQICSLQLIDVFKKHAIKYETERMRIDIDVTECFNEGSEDGQYLVDFLSHVINFHKSVSSQFYAEFVAFLKESSRLTLDQKPSKWLFETECEAIFIQKQRS